MKRRPWSENVIMLLAIDFTSLCSWDITCIRRCMSLRLWNTLVLGPSGFYSHFYIACIVRGSIAPARYEAMIFYKVFKGFCFIQGSAQNKHVFPDCLQSIALHNQQYPHASCHSVFLVYLTFWPFVHSHHCWIFLIKASKTTSITYCAFICLWWFWKERVFFPFSGISILVGLPFTSLQYFFGSQTSPLLLNQLAHHNYNSALHCCFCSDQRAKHLLASHNSSAEFPLTLSTNYFPSQIHLLQDWTSSLSICSTVVGKSMLP